MDFRKTLFGVDTDLLRDLAEETGVIASIDADRSRLFDLLLEPDLLLLVTAIDFLLFFACCLFALIAANDFLRDTLELLPRDGDEVAVSESSDDESSKFRSPVSNDRLIDAHRESCLLNDDIDDLLPPLSLLNGEHELDARDTMDTFDFALDRSTSDDNNGDDNLFGSWP